MGLNFLPIGGVGEIGMNNMVLAWNGRRYLIDCGAKFPGETSRFAELVLPDLGWLRANKSSFDGIVITHGHEDHIGALPFVARELQVPIYASPFSYALARRRLDEHNVHGLDFRPMEPHAAGGVGEFIRPPERPELGFQLIRVTHSIPDAAALLIDTPIGRVLHTGDFKVDPEPIDGKHFDTEAFRRIGDDGVLLMMSDSTNAQVPGRTESERSVIREIEAQVRAWPGRVVISQFASNLHRLRGLEEVALATGRRLCLVGRSFKTYTDIARAHGLQTVNPDLLLDPETVERVDPKTVILVLTGSQGERRAALWKAANGEHPHVKLGKQDLVMMSSRVIPGNEREIYAMFNDIRRRGATVLHPKAAGIHTSGHARQDELTDMIRLVRPKAFVPVHGEYAFLLDHEALAKKAGIERTLVVEDGEEFEVSPDGQLSRVASRGLETHYLDGTVTGNPDELGFEDRRRMFHNGVLTVVAELSPGKPGRFAPDVELQSAGVYTAGDKHLDVVLQELLDVLESIPRESSDDVVEGTIVSVVKRYFKRTVGKKPLVLVFIRRVARPGESERQEPAKNKKVAA